MAIPDRMGKSAGSGRAEAGVAVLICCLLLGVPQAIAASPPPAASPERTLPWPGVSPPDDLPLPPAPAGPVTVEIAPRPAGAGEIMLTLQEVELEGATAYSPPELALLWRDLLGRQISLAEVYALAENITRRYREDGYIMARASVPPQEICCGKVRLSVDEGRIDTVTAQGHFATLPLVDDAVRRLRRLKLVNLRRIEREMLLLNDLPGSNFRVVLVPGHQGLVSVVVLGEAEPALTGSLQIDNSGSRYLGPYLATATLAAPNLFAPLQETTLSVSAASEIDELAGGTLVHIMPLWNPRLLLTVEASITRGAPGYSLSASDIFSRSHQLSAHVDYSLYRQRTDSLIVTAGLTLRNSMTDVAGVSLSQDRIRTLFAGIRYDWQDFLNGYNLLQLQGTHGIPALLGGSDTGDAGLSRPAARGDFSKIDLSLLRNQPLGGNLSLFGAVRAQFSGSPLLSSEEFGFGGPFIGRAYDSSEKTGDSGFGLLAELRFRSLEGAAGIHVQPFVFADYGAVWNRDGGQPKRDEGASAGAGVRLGRGAMEGSLMLAQPLLESRESTYPNNPGPRLLFSVRASF